MLLSKKHIVKLYYEGHREPFVEFIVSGQHLYVLDGHLLKVDGISMKFPDNVFVYIWN